MKNIIWPKRLRKGDTVALIAPSSSTDVESVKIAADSIRFLDLYPKIYPSCLCSHGYLSGNDERRVSDLNAAFEDDKVQGIFCLRGGYGAMRLLKHIDYEMISNHPKIFCGYSDITALHTVFNNICGFVTFHAPMPITDYRNMDNFSLLSLKDAIFGNWDCRDAQAPLGMSISSVCGGIASGRLTGGNLSLLASTLGSRFEIDTRDAILFIEETDEELYKIDRALTALALAGKFEDCRGILLGTFSGCSSSNPLQSLTLDEIFNEIFSSLNKPIISNFQCGHSYPQHTLALGRQIEISADDLNVRFL